MHEQPPLHTARPRYMPLARRHKMQAGAWLRAQREVSTPEWTKAGVPNATTNVSSVFNAKKWTMTPRKQ